MHAFIPPLPTRLLALRSQRGFVMPRARTLPLAPRAHLDFHSGVPPPVHRPPSDFCPIVQPPPTPLEEATAWSGDIPPPPGPSDSPRDDSDPGDSSPPPDSNLSALLASNNAALADIPPDILAAYTTGSLTLANIANFLHARANLLSRFLMKAGPGMRNRFLADKLFLLKILIEEGIGVFGKLSAEYEQRREDFFRQGEFVLANLVTAVLADFALVYLPAPSVALSSGGGRGVGAWFKEMATMLPSNVFQTDRPFTLAQRVAGFALKGGQLFAVGMLCCFAGVILTNSMIFVRERVDKSYKPQTQKQNPLAVSLLYATFLGLSSGSRYQLVNGVESHIFPRVFAHTPRLAEEVATFLLRYGNTFWGSQQWVMFCRFTNVQKVKTSDQ